MNRSTVITLLNRRKVMWDLGRPADADMIDEWHRLLQKVADQDAFDALDRCKLDERPPSPARLLNELRASHTPTAVRPLGTPDCGMCDGTGYALTRDPNEPGVDRYTACPVCRPDAAEKMKQAAARHPAAAPMRSVIGEGAEERRAAWAIGEAEYVAVLRRQFPKTAVLTETDIRDRMRRIKPLPGYGAARPDEVPPAS
jgi:hypothetical protein